MNKTEWFGELPSTWDVTRLKNVLIERNESNKPVKTDFILSLTNDRGVIPYSEKGAVGNNSKDDITGYKLAYPKDLVLNSMNVVIGSVGISEYFGCVSPVYYMLRPRNHEDPVEFYNYLFQTNEMQSALKGYGNGIMEIRMRIAMSKLNTFNLPIPSSQAQRKIVDRIRESENRIDQLIANQQQQIEKLKEYKQSLISEVVTKGLYPNAEFKESGINWIGNIPSKWKVIRIKDFTKLKGRIGWQGLTTSDYIEEGPLLITGTDFSNGSIDWTTCVHISEERFNEAPEIHVKENDLLITKDGTIGKVAIVRNLENKASLNSGVLLIRVLENFNFDKSFIYFVLQSDSFWVWYNSSQTGGSTIKHLYQNQFSYFSFAYPDIDEQRHISEYLYSRVSKIDKLIEMKNSKIDKLNDYKKSLIYEYVTGKRIV